MISKRAKYAAAAAAAVTIAVFSLIPKPPDIDAGFRYTDKIAHFIAYFGLSFLVAVCIGIGKKRGAWLFAAAATFFYGAVIEGLQSFTPRQVEGLDLLANLAGSLCGAFLCAWIGRRSRKER